MNMIQTIFFSCLLPKVTYSHWALALLWCCVVKITFFFSFHFWCKNWPKTKRCVCVRFDSYFNFWHNTQLNNIFNNFILFTGVSMARTKQTAKNSTGGKQPAKTLSARKPIPVCTFFIILLNIHYILFVKSKESKYLDSVK